MQLQDSSEKTAKVLLDFLLLKEVLFCSVLFIILLNSSVLFIILLNSSSKKD